MNLPLLLLAAVVPASAQVAAPDVRFSAIAAEATQAPAAPTLAAGEAKAPPSCEPGKELETAFTLSVPDGDTVPLSYAGCTEEGSNDYLSGYTERHYTGTGGYGMTLVTEHGDGAYPKPDEDKSSDVLISKGKDWVGRLGIVANAAIVSGRAVAADGYMIRAGNAPRPSTAACEAKLPKPVYGPVELWLLTKTQAFYYHEDCDICAELDSCDLETGAIKEELVAHSVSCEDLAKYKKGADVYFDACVGRR